jgi:hypothetical protein
MKVAGRVNFFLASTFIRFAEIEKAAVDDSFTTSCRQWKRRMEEDIQAC